jgi:hypothetical protein
MLNQIDLSRTDLERWYRRRFGPARVGSFIIFATAPAG